MRTKYPRTPHLPWSPGASADDVRLSDVRALEGREVVVTEKLDGENTTLYRDGLHARSLDSGHHPSRSWVKALHGRVASRIPEGFRVCGENVFARHSIGYRELDSYFHAFSVWTDRGVALGWDETVRFARRLGVPTPRVSWRGIFDERAIRRIRVDRDRVEGYVVRPAGEIPFASFGELVGKWVRSAHVTTDAHWMNADVVPNALGDRAALWDVRSGAPPDGPALMRAIGEVPTSSALERAQRVAARLDLFGRAGDARLAPVLAALLSETSFDVPDRHRDERARSFVASWLPPVIGMRLARTVADLVGRRRAASWEMPDAERASRLRRIARGSDVAALLALADPPSEPEVAERIALFELFAGEAGVLDEAPFEALRAPLDEALREDDEDARDLAWAGVLDRFCEGRIASPEQAIAFARAPRGPLPRLVITVGPSGSGKSTLVEARYGGWERIALDELRAARGDRADRSHDADVLREATARLEDAMRRGARAVWEATSLHPRQRAIPLSIARRHGALVTYAVLLVPEDDLSARNRARAHAVPRQVLESQLARRVLPHAGEADRIHYVDAEGDVADVSGSLGDREHAAFGARA